MPPLQQQNKPLNWLEKVFHVLNTTERASAATAAGLLGKDAGEYWRSGKDYQDLVDEMMPNVPTVIRRAVGLAAGYGLDPLTWTGIGAVGKSAGAGRSLLTFAGKDIIKGESVFKALGKAAESFVGTKPGRILAESFGHPEILRKSKFPEVQKIFELNQQKIGKELADVHQYEMTLRNLYAERGLDEASKKKLRDMIETLPRATRQEFEASEKAVARLMGEDSAEIYRMAIMQDHVGKMALEARSRLIGLTPEQEAGFLKKTGLQHLPHYAITAPSKKKIMREIQRMAISPNEIKNVPMKTLMHRYLPGTLTEKAAKYGKRIWELEVPRIMGLHAAEVAHSELSIDYLKQVVKSVGKSAEEGKGLPGYFSMIPEKDPTGGLLTKIFMDEHGKPLLLPEELKGELVKVVKGVTDIDGVSNGLLGVFDGFTNWWRRTTLYTVPSTLTRNFLGNIWNINLAGGTTYNDFKSAGKFMWRIRHGNLIDSDIKHLENLLGFKVINQTRAAKEAGRLSTTIKDAALNGDWYPWQLLGKNSGPINIGQWVNDVIENHAKISLYFSRVRQGWEPIDAALTVKKYLFHYGKEGLSDIEYNLLRRVLPFYTWTRNNLPLQLEMLITKPGKFANLGKTIAAVEGVYGKQPVETWMSDYMRENMPVHLRQNEKGQEEYFLLRSWLPAGDLLMLEDPVQDLLSMVNPWIKEPLQQAANIDFWLEREITRLPEDLSPMGGEFGNFLGMVMNKRAIHLMKNFRMLHELDRLNPFQVFGKDRPHHIDLPTTQRWLTLVAGRMYPYDPEKARQLWMYEFEKKVSDLKRLVKYASRRGYREESEKYRQNLTKFMAEKAKEIRGQ